MYKKLLNLLSLFFVIFSFVSCSVSSRHEYDSFLINDKATIQFLNSFSCFYKDSLPGQNRYNCFKSLYTGKDYFFNGGFYDQMNNDVIYRPISIEFGAAVNNYYVCYIPKTYTFNCFNYLSSENDPDIEGITNSEFSAFDYVEGSLFYAAKKLNYLRYCKWYCFNKVDQIRNLLSVKDCISIILFSKDITIKKDIINNKVINKTIPFLGRKVFERETLLLLEDLGSSIFDQENRIFELNGTQLITCDIKENFNLEAANSPSIYTVNHIPYHLKMNTDNTYLLDKETIEFIVSDFPNIYDEYLDNSNDYVSENAIYEILNKMRD